MNNTEQRDKPSVFDAILKLADEQERNARLMRQQRDTHTTKPILKALLDASESFADDPVEAYWKSKQGKCLACNAPIALEDQYCGACTEFLMEVHTQTPNPLT